MFALFTSDGCSTCRRIIRDIPDSWASQIVVLRVEFDEELNYYRIYENGKPLKGRAPVSTVPVLWISDTKEVHQGYTKIMDRLSNVKG